MTASEIVGRLSRAGVIAVLRAPDWNTCVHAANALLSGGILGIEVTYSTPNATRAITALSESLPADAVLGAGTVTTAAQALQAVDAGASFLVSPGTSPQLAQAMKDTGAACLMGAYTPSEVQSVLAWGADVVKLFPASHAGPGYLRALRGPYPDVPFMPTGGVNPANLSEWKHAGVAAVGAGGDLCPSSLLQTADWKALTRRAAEFAQAWKEA